MNIFSRWFEPKAFHQGYLRVSEKHRIFFREFGKPSGVPVICFHGGPGYWSNAGTAGNFNLKKCRVILFDQRGCGKSLPAGEVAENTTQDLVEDAARLLAHLQITEPVVVFGSSWGATLALLFAEKYPEKVRRLIVAKVFLANQDNRMWEQLYSGWFYPDVMALLREPLPDGEDVPAFYYRQIMSGDLQKQVRAVQLYGRYERVLGEVSVAEAAEPVTESDVSSCRVMMHYAAHKFFLAENEILAHAERLKTIPVVIVHNRLDMVCPLIGAYELHRRLPLSDLRIVPDRGHGSRLLTKQLQVYTRNIA